MLTDLFQKKKTVIKSSFAAIAMMSLATACGGGSGADNQQFQVDTGIKPPSFEITNNTIIISQVFPHVSLDGGGSYPIPHMPNSSLMVGPDLLSDGLLVQAVLSAQDVLDLTNSGGTLLDPSKLPDGRPLPIFGGTMPGVAVQIPKWHNITFYAGVQNKAGVFALFFPVNIPIDELQIHYAFKKNGKRIGQLSAIGRHNGGGSGAFVAINIGKNEQALLKSMAAKAALK